MRLWGDIEWRGDFHFCGAFSRRGVSAIRPNLFLILIGAVIGVGLLMRDMSAQRAALSADGVSSGGVTLSGSLGAIVAILVYFVVFYKAFASLLYEKAPRGPGFAHLRAPVGGFGRFVWVNFLLALMCLAALAVGLAALVGISRALFAFTSVGQSRSVALTTLAVLGLIAVLVIFPATSLVTARYGLSLPAVLTGDKDTSFKTARKRAAPRFWILGFTLTLITFSYMLWVVLGSMAYPTDYVSLFGLNGPAMQKAVRLKMLLGTAYEPGFWILQFVGQLIFMTTTLFYAGALAVAWREAAAPEGRAAAFE